MNGTGKTRTTRPDTWPDFEVYPLSLRIFPKRIESGPENMATDWWLFLKQGEQGCPAFRHYGWIAPEASFGYGQDWTWVQKHIGRDSENTVRRPTGGGIVRHGKDWTYCLVLPKGHHSFAMPALDLYEKIHQAMSRCLKEQDLPVSLKPCPELRQKGIPGDCFSEPVARDLMSEDGTQKIAGAAMKRTRAGVLVQGTMDLATLSSFDEETFFSNFVNEVSCLVDEPPEYMDWPKEFAKGRRGFVRQFASLPWLTDRAVS